MSKSPTLFSSDDEDEGPELEEVLLKKFQAMMRGVPPPSSITMSKLSPADMLMKYKENDSIFGIKDLAERKCHKTKKSTPLVYYFNSSKTSEEIAILSQKVLNRYVYSETMSSCNVWFESSLTTSSAKKKLSRRNRSGFSPGSRLSHLARRRQIFSSENLQKLANSERRRHIEIEKQNTSKSRSFLSNSMVELDKINSFKRALFLSPEDDEAKQRNFAVSSQENLVSSSNNNIVRDKGKMVWHSQPDINSTYSRKRKRLESGNSWPRRALTFTEKELCKSQDSNSTNNKVISEIQLSLHHKTKLLWAVSVTLKEKNINSTDPQFKTCASALFMICRKNLTTILNSKVSESTSDKILYFAREHVDEILEKLEIFRGSPKAPKTECQKLIQNDSNSEGFSKNQTNENSFIFEKISTSDNEGNYPESGRSDEPKSTSSTLEDVTATSNEKENINSLADSFNLISQN